MEALIKRLNDTQHKENGTERLFTGMVDCDKHRHLHRDLNHDFEVVKNSFFMMGSTDSRVTVVCL